MEALSIGKRRRAILITNNNQCGDTNLLDFFVHVLAGDNTGCGSCHPPAMIANEPLLPLASLFSAGGVVEKLRTEHDLHDLIAHKTQTHPTRAEAGLFISGAILHRLRAS